MTLIHQIIYQESVGRVPVLSQGESKCHTVKVHTVLKEADLVKTELALIEKNITKLQLKENQKINPSKIISAEIYGTCKSWIETTRLYGSQSYLYL